jgi:hypothetical protein
MISPFRLAVKRRIIMEEGFDQLVQMVPGLSVWLTKMTGLERWTLENKLLDLLKIKLAHQDFADLTASTRERVTATISMLKNRTLLTMKASVQRSNRLNRRGLLPKRGRPDER